MASSAPRTNLSREIAVHKLQVIALALKEEVSYWLLRFSDTITQFCPAHLQARHIELVRADHCAAARQRPTPTTALLGLILTALLVTHFDQSLLALTAQVAGT